MKENCQNDGASVQSCPPQEKYYQACCPSYSTWFRFNQTNKILTNGTITDAYRKEFEKCRTPEFINFGEKAIKEELKASR